MWHGSWVLIWRRCHWVTTLLLMMILAYVTGTHTIILGGIFLQIHPRHLSFSLSLYFFFRGEEGSKCCVMSFIFHSASTTMHWRELYMKQPSTFIHLFPGQITQYWSPLISLLWGTVVVFPWDPETRVPQPPTSFSQQHLSCRLYQMFLDGLGQKSASNDRGCVNQETKGWSFVLFAVCIKCFFKSILRQIPRNLAELWSYTGTQKGGGVFFLRKVMSYNLVPRLKNYQRPSYSAILFTPT